MSMTISVVAMKATSPPSRPKPESMSRAKTYALQAAQAGNQLAGFPPKRGGRCRRLRSAPA
jgi:conjugal transfer/entry exclusion protein